MKTGGSSDVMGAFFSVNAQQNISTSQISEINQNCVAYAGAKIEDANITIIDSHVGDVELTQQLTVGNMTCVLDAVSVTNATNKITNTASADISLLPFSFDAAVVNVNDITNIFSYQQSVINQACTQTVELVVKDYYLTIIDSSTGNIRVGQTGNVASFSCNLTASTYQGVANSVTDQSSAKISESCCGFDLAMLIPMLLGIVAVIVVSKVAIERSKKGNGDQVALTALADFAIREGPPAQSM